MFAFVVFVFVFRYQAKRLAGKNVSEMTYFVSGARKTLVLLALEWRQQRDARSGRCFAASK